MRAFVFVAVLLLWIPAVVATVEPAGTLPAPLVGASGAEIAGKAYLIGGRGNDGTLSDAIYAYDPATQTTTRVGTFPTPLTANQPGIYSTAAATLHGRAYILGGAYYEYAQLQPPPQPPSTVPRSSDEIVVFDPTTGTASSLPDRLPTGLWGAAAIAHDGVIDLFGGFTFDVAQPGSIGRHNSIIRFDPTQPPGLRVTTLAATLPYRVQDAAAARVDGVGYLLGGLAEDDTPCADQQRVCVTDKIIAIDLAHSAAVEYGRLATPVHFAPAVSAGGVAMVIGGRGPDGSASNTIQVFDPAAATTTVRTDEMPEGRFGGPSVILGEYAYAFGGRGGASTVPLDTIVSISLDPEGTPITPPGAPHSVFVNGRIQTFDLKRVNIISWERPDHDGGAPFLQYEVYRDVGESSISIGRTWSPTFTDCDTRFAIGASYHVIASNSAGSGPASQSARPGPVKTVVRSATDLTAPATCW